MTRFFSFFICVFLFTTFLNAEKLSHVVYEIPKISETLELQLINEHVAIYKDEGLDENPNHFFSIILHDGSDWDELKSCLVQVDGITVIELKNDENEYLQELKFDFTEGNQHIERSGLMRVFKNNKQAIQLLCLTSSDNYQENKIKIFDSLEAAYFEDDVNY